MLKGPIDVGRVRALHARLYRDHVRMVDKITQRSENFAVTHVRQHSGLKRRTGNLFRSTSAKVIRTSKGRLVKIQNSAKYAAAQDGGSGLHGPKRRKYPITPRRAGGSLRFVVGGKVVFAKKVMHPGVRPTRFLYRATRASFRVAGHEFDSRMRELASRWKRWR